MGNFFINVIGILVIFWILWFLYLKINPKAFDNALEKQAAKARAMVHKKDTDLIGKRMFISRENQDPVQINFYQPFTKDNQAAIFVCHGGTFMDGDADQLDTWCDRMSRQWDKTMISINYTKIDKKKIPYQQDEIRDTVLYFAKNASNFHLDGSKFAFLGFSAGAYLEVGAASLLRDRGYIMKGAILVQPFIDDTLVRLADAQIHVSPVSIVVAGQPKGDHVEVYSKHLEDAGVDVMVKKYTDAVPGFIEYNNPEYEKNKFYKKSGAFTDEQKDMAHACEMWIGNQFDGYLSSALK